MTQGWFRFQPFCTSWAQCQQALPSTVSLGVRDVTTGATYHHILAYSITNNRVICHSSGMCSSFCLTDLYFSINCLVSSSASVPVHGQIANSREKTLSSISKHLISWLKISHRRDVSSLYASKCIYSWDTITKWTASYENNFAHDRTSPTHLHSNYLKWMVPVLLLFIPHLLFCA